jgi:ankyrin repeat protein
MKGVTVDYFNMRLIQQAYDKAPEDDSQINFLSPLHFICIRGMTYVISTYLSPQKKRKKRFRLRLFRERVSPLDHPFNLDFQDNRGSTPLHYACQNGFYDTVVLLLKGGARGHLQNKDGHTPFSYALQEGEVFIAELLIEKGRHDKHCENTITERL